METIKTNSHTRVFQRMFGADSVDCHFTFVDEPTDEVKLIPAHRKVLAAISPVFAVMFGGGWSENANAIVIKDASFGSFHAFMQYFYVDTFRLTADNVADLLTLADRYDVQDLITHCEAFLLKHLSADNVFEYLAIAARFERTLLKTECERLYKSQPERILLSESFPVCDPATLATFLRLLPKSCDAAKVFDAFIGWAERRCQETGKDETNMKNLRAELGQCFAFIQFKEMSFKAIAQRYKTYKMLFTMDERDEIIEHLLENTGNRYHLLAKMKCVGVREFRGGAVPNDIRFKVDKPVILHGVTFASTFLQHDGAEVGFFAEITVKAQDDEVLFSRMVELAVKNMTFIFPLRLVLDARKVYTISLIRDLSSYKVYGYTFRQKKLGAVEFIPVRKENEGNGKEGRWCGTEIRFIDVGEDSV